MCVLGQHDVIGKSNEHVPVLFSLLAATTQLDSLLHALVESSQPRAEGLTCGSEVIACPSQRRLMLLTSLHQHADPMSGIIAQPLRVTRPYSTPYCNFPPYSTSS